MLRVDGDDLRSALLGFPEDELTGDDERFLVRQREPLARADRGVRRPKAQRADEGADDDVGGRQRRDLVEPLAAVDDADPAAGGQQGLEARGFLGTGNRDELGPVGGDLVGQPLDRAAGGEGDGPEPIGKSGDHLQRGAPDGPRRAEHGHFLHENR